MFNLCKFSVKSKKVANIVGVCIDFHHGSSVNLTCSIMPSYYLAELLTGYLLKGAVSRQSSSLCLNFALIAMELKVSKGITYFLTQNNTPEQFSKTLISIRFNLLPFCPSVASVVSVTLF